MRSFLGHTERRGGGAGFCQAAGGLLISVGGFPGDQESEGTGGIQLPERGQHGGQAVESFLRPGVCQCQDEQSGGGQAEGASQRSGLFLTVSAGLEICEVDAVPSGADGQAGESGTRVVRDPQGTGGEQADVFFCQGFQARGPALRSVMKCQDDRQAVGLQGAQFVGGKQMGVQEIRAKTRGGGGDGGGADLGIGGEVREIGRVGGRGEGTSAGLAEDDELGGVSCEGELVVEVQGEAFRAAVLEAGDDLGNADGGVLHDVQRGQVDEARMVFCQEAVETFPCRESGAGGGIQPQHRRERGGGQR